MLDWWNSLSFLGQVLACMAIPATLVLIVQTIMVLVTGFDGDTDVDVISGDEIDDVANFDEQGIQIFTVRGIITFFAVFGWAGMAFISLNLGAGVALLLAFALGAAAMFGTAYAMKALMGMQSNGNQEISDAIGASGTVYIQIPANRRALGKVNAVVSGRYGEFDAMTDDEEDISTGSAVIIISVTEPNILMVTKK